MQPSNFEESNIVLSPPKGVSPDVVEPLNVFGFNDPKLGLCFTSCWKVTEDELAQIQKTGRVWLTVVGGHPPVALYGVKPMGTVGE